MTSCPSSPDPAEQFARDRRAGELLTLAARLAVTVRDQGADAAAAHVAGLDHRALVELNIVMAALIPTDRTLPELLGWMETGWAQGAAELPAWLLPFATERYGHAGTPAPCGTRHDRDINAAKNILAAGRAVSACGADVRHSGSSRVRSAVKQEAQPVRAGIPRL